MSTWSDEAAEIFQNAKPFPKAGISSRWRWICLPHHLPYRKKCTGRCLCPLHIPLDYINSYLKICIPTSCTSEIRGMSTCWFDTSPLPGLTYQIQIGAASTLPYNQGNGNPSWVKLLSLAHYRYPATSRTPPSRGGRQKKDKWVERKAACEFCLAFESHTEAIFF